MKQIELCLAPPAKPLLPMAPADYWSMLDSYSGKNQTLSSLFCGGAEPVAPCPEIAALTSEIAAIKRRLDDIATGAARSIVAVSRYATKLRADLDEASDPERFDPRETTLRTAKGIVARHYDGMCPCCLKRPACHWDHWVSRRANSLCAGWWICAEGNLRLGPANGPARIKPENQNAYARFQEFVRALKAAQGRLL